MNSAQAVVIGEKVYLGGGNTENVEYDHQVFQYDPSRDEWSRLPPHKAIFFSIAQFKGSLITVGGVKDSVITGKVYRFIEESQNWKKVHKPMPTARYWSSVATTQSAIVASGGVTDVRDVTGKDRKPVPCATVEVYSRETSQWHTADPLPVPCLLMTLSPSQTPGTKWGDMMLIMPHPPSCTLLLPPSFRKPPHLLTSQQAPCLSGRPSLTPH